MGKLQTILLTTVLALVPALLGGGIGQTEWEASGTGAEQEASATDAEQEGPAADPPTLGRLAGEDRYGTSVMIARWTFDPGQADTVYLARGDVFIDALTAGSLTDGPVLLVPDCAGVPRTVAEEIERLDPEGVTALGGEESVCEETLEQAGEGRHTDRLAGQSRDATAAAIANHEFADGAETVYLAQGSDTSPDAVAGGTLTDGPILLVSRDGTTLPQATREAIADLDPDQVIGLGGRSAVSYEVLEEAADGRDRDRIGGQDRYGTAMQIAQAAFPDGNERIYLARGDAGNVADAVASGVLTDGPVVLVQGSCEGVPEPVRDYLVELEPERIAALGGTSAVCTDLLHQARDVVAPPPGPDCDVDKCIALTFDDGPSPHTGELLDTLDELDVPATFFVVGQSAQNDPDTVARIHEEGHEVQNHTWDHPQLPDLSLAEQQEQYDSTQDYLSEIGAPETDQLRPPYGAWDANTRDLGVPLILWSIDTRDWETRDADAIREEVSANLHDGAIVLQHDTVPESVEAVPGIVADLREQDYHFVTVADLVPDAEAGDLVYSRDRVEDITVPECPQLNHQGEYVGPSTADEDR